MRTERDSEFYIDNEGLVSVSYKGTTYTLGRAGIDPIEPDLFHGEKTTVEHWGYISDILVANRVRSKINLHAERRPPQLYGFLWASFSFDRMKARKRWGSGLALDRAAEALAEAIPEKTYPDYHGRIEKEPTRWVFDIEINDFEPRDKFFKVFFRALDKRPVLREYLMPG